jgi:hypothetical protein
MSYQLELDTEQARLVYLALAYHLARPGSEVDPETLQPVAHGLLEVAEDLRPRLNDAQASITLSPFQWQRLAQAMLGGINELKAYPMLKAQSRPGGGPASAVPGFDAMLATLFPEIVDDENVALDLAESMMLLRRRIDAAVAESQRADEPVERDSPEAPHPRWQFWRR